MRINWCCAGIGRTGGNRVILEYNRWLNRKGHDSVVYYNAFDAGWLYGDDERLLLTCIKTDNYNNIRDADCTLATFWATAPIVLERGTGTKMYFMQHYEPLFDRLRWNIIAQTYALPLKKIANSHWLSRMLMVMYRMSKIPVVIPAVDKNIFKPDLAPREPKTVLVFSKNVDWKGALEQMEILPKLRESGVKVIGYGERLGDLYDEFYENLTDEELAKLYCRASAYLSTSWYESSPLPHLEALACGTPVITAPLGVEDAEYEGCVVYEPRDIEGCIKTVLSWLEVEVAFVDRQRTWEDAAVDMESTIRRLL